MLTAPTRRLPNWALAGVLAGFVAGTYYYSLRAVSVDDVGKELELEAARQERESRAPAAVAADSSKAQHEASGASAVRSPTVFERRLYQVCKAIPRGKVATYGTLAALTKSSPRAVGQALKRNPYAPEIPCHRVVASTLSLGGFKGDWGDTPKVRNKKQMLEAEGVRFDGARVASSDYVVSADCLPSA